MSRAWLARQPSCISCLIVSRRFSGQTCRRSALPDSPKVRTSHQKVHHESVHTSISRWPDGFRYAYRYAWQLAIISANLFIFGHLFMNYIGTIRLVAGPSMYPTLEVSGDWVLISKLHRRGRWIQAGDVVSFDHPIRQGYRAMKRVVGMPGDFVLRDTPRGYNSDNTQLANEQWMVQVPEGHCWVAGDNLEWSRDSRHFGPLPLALIRGKAVARTSRGSLKWHWIGGGMKDFDSEVVEDP